MSMTDEQVRAALAEAWDKGKVSGKSITMRRMSDEPEAPEPVNPYDDPAAPIPRGRTVRHLMADGMVLACTGARPDPSDSYVSKPNLASCPECVATIPGARR